MKNKDVTDPYRAQKAKLMEAILREGLQKKGKLIQILGGIGSRNATAAKDIEHLKATLDPLIGKLNDLNKKTRGTNR